jgi:hypothetical protein
VRGNGGQGSGWTGLHQPSTATRQIGTISQQREQSSHQRQQRAEQSPAREWSRADPSSRWKHPRHQTETHLQTLDYPDTINVRSSTLAADYNTQPVSLRYPPVGADLPRLISITPVGAVPPRLIPIEPRGSATLGQPSSRSRSRPRSAHAGAHAGAPAANLWAESIDTANYLRHRSPSLSIMVDRLLHDWQCFLLVSSSVVQS